MPHEEAQLNMRMFADRVMPVLQHDQGFAVATNGVPSPVGIGGPTGIFAPA